MELLFDHLFEDLFGDGIGVLLKERAAYHRHEGHYKHAGNNYQKVLHFIKSYAITYSVITTNPADPAPPALPVAVDMDAAPLPPPP